MSRIHRPHYTHSNRQQGVIEWDARSVGDGCIHSDGCDYQVTLLDIVNERAPKDGELVSFIPEADTGEPRARKVAIAEDPLPGRLRFKH